MEENKMYFLAGYLNIMLTDPPEDREAVRKTCISSVKMPLISC